MEIIHTKNFELAIYTKGDKSSAKVAIVIPGRLDSKDYIHNMSLVDCLAGRGYLALSFDWPGIWESPGSIDLYTTTNCLKAVDELIEYFGNKPTLLAGHSRGGTVSMLAGPKNPYVTHFISIFSYYGAPSEPEKDRIKDGCVTSYRDLPPGNIKTKEQKIFELPLGYFTDGSQYNALSNLERCIKPKLFLYATKDDIDPDDIKIAYEKSAEPKIIFGLESYHDYRYDSKVVDQVNAYVGKFLDVYK